MIHAMLGIVFSSFVLFMAVVKLVIPVVPANPLFDIFIAWVLLMVGIGTLIEALGKW